MRHFSNHVCNTGASILLIGGFELEHAILMSIARSMGVGVERARTIEDAQGATGGCDLALFDARLCAAARMTEIEAVRQHLRARLAGRTVPFVVFSGRADPKIEAMNVDATIATPFRFEDIRTLLDARRPIIAQSSARPIEDGEQGEDEDWSFAAYMNQTDVAKARERLRRDLDAFIGLCATDAPLESARRAHMLISSARILGYSDLARACQRFERSLTCGEGKQSAQDILAEIVAVRRLVVEPGAQPDESWRHIN